MKKLVLSPAITMIGGIVGAGIFGVPYVFSRSGVPLGIVYLVVLGAAAILTNVYYAIVASETPGKHRLVGYINKHYGERSKYFVAFINIVELLGALLVYIILGGSFLSVIFGGTSGFWMAIFFLVVAAILLLPLKKSDGVDRFFTCALIVVVIAVVALIFPQVKIANLTAVHWSNWFVPYGVIFFAVGGASVIPEIVELSRKRESSAIRAAVLGTAAAAVMIGIFSVFVVGVCGAGTTENAIAGLALHFGRPIIILCSVFGVLAMATQFVVVGSYIRDQFVYDFKMPRTLAWLIAIGLPIVAYGFGARDFISIIGFIGATFGAAAGLSIVLMARKIMVKKNEFKLLRRFAVPLMILFVAGMAAEIVSFL